MVKLIVACLPFLIAAGCSTAETPPQMRASLPGEYTLEFGSSASAGSPRPQMESLTLDSQGGFTQSCVLANGQRVSTVGTWTYDQERIHLSSLRDCTGVWGAAGNAIGSAHLRVEGDADPLIVLSPDMNVFYRKRR